MWRLTVKHALILVNNDMIFNSFSCKVQQQKIDEESSVEFGIYQLIKTVSATKLNDITTFALRKGTKVVL